MGVSVSTKSVANHRESSPDLDGSGSQAPPSAGTARERRWVAIHSLLHGDSPRRSGEDPQHTRTLAQLDGNLPPILVHRRSMRVIDGMHRLHAAALRGHDFIEVEFFDGTEEDAFIAAVRANVAHGLPLTLADREAAAERIITSHPHLSDRSIALTTGLSAQTTGVIRRRLGDDALGGVRIGRDGRRRPLDSADARRVASHAMAVRPDASLREIAQLAGISPATVRDVRERMRRGDDPVPLRPRSRRPASGEPPRAVPTETTPTSLDTAAAEDPGDEESDQADGAELKALLASLSKDPSLRYNARGRKLLRVLFAQAGGLEACQRMVQDLPPHSRYLIVQIARSCADEWLDFAAQLQQQLRASG
jgi:transposase